MHWKKMVCAVLNRRTVAALTAAATAALSAGCHQPEYNVSVSIDLSASNRTTLPGEFETFNGVFDETLAGSPLALRSFGFTPKTFYNGRPNDSDELLEEEREILAWPAENESRVEDALKAIVSEPDSLNRRVVFLLWDGGRHNEAAFRANAEAVSKRPAIIAFVIIGCAPDERARIEDVLVPLFGKRLVVATTADRADIPRKLRTLL